MTVKLGVELRLPSVLSGTLTERALLASEGRSKDTVVILKLSGVVGILGNIITESGSVCRRAAWQDTKQRRQ